MSTSVKQALIDDARMIASKSRFVVWVIALISAGAFAVGLVNVGARAPADLPVLCVGVAVAVAACLLFLKMRERSAVAQRMTEDGLTGITQNADGTFWLHFDNGDHFLSAAPPAIRTEELRAALTAKPAPPPRYARAVIVCAALLAPLGAGLILNFQPVPAKISQIDSTRGTLLLTGTVTLVSKNGVTIGKSDAYVIVRIHDGSGERVLYVKADAMTDADLERAAEKSGLAVRVVVHTKRVKHEGVAMKEIDALIADSIELQDSF